MKPEITDHHAKLTCRVVRAANQFTGKQALLYSPGISAEAVGAKGNHLQILTIPPLGRAKAHKHGSHETAIYALSGESGFWDGVKIEKHLNVQTGGFGYISPGLPHLTCNPSKTAMF